MSRRAAVPRRQGARSPRAAVACLLLALSLPAAVAGADFDTAARAMFPGAEQVGALAGEPPAAPVTGGGRLLGYALLSDRVAPIPAYSGKPIRVLIGIDTQGVIRGARIVHHEEPILVVGVTDEALARFTDQYRGHGFGERFAVGGEPAPGKVILDGISGATITMMVLNASILRSVAALAGSRGLPLNEDAAREQLAAATAGLGAAAAEAQAATGGGAAQVAATGLAARATGRGATPARGERPDGDWSAPARGSRSSGAGGNALAADVPEPIWKQLWLLRTPRLWILGAGLAVLTFVLFLQDWLTRHPQWVRWFRTGFLVYTLVFIGWYGLAQLSVVNVLTFVHSAVRDFRWETFLIEPMIFVLWSFVAVSLLLWGRGVYCGWLCPYGALQELVNKAAQGLGVRQFPLPALVHERLLAIKYVILLALFGLSLQSLTEAVRFAEVEPFKTVFALRLDRPWPFVAYALGLVAVSAVNGKFFCKYLCPLGAAITIPAHFRIFDWLRRRKECGRPCQTCAAECPSQAIRPTGEINANECHYCLDCQLTFWDTHKCPPLVERRRKAERVGRTLDKLPLR